MIPLRSNSKVPLCKGWSKKWTLEHNRSTLRRFPDANIGLLLGDVVDVEGDSEHANRLLLDLIGDYPHPNYRSTKSIHHLFLTPDPHLRIFRFEEIEFRGEGHQSVLPPSQHQGISYSWLGEIFPVPPMPKRLLDFFKRQRHGHPVNDGHRQVWCAVCLSKCRMHWKRFQLELNIFRALGSDWKCRKCRDLDLRPLCRTLAER